MEASPLSRLEDLPGSLMRQIVDYLTFSEAHKTLFAVNRRFWLEHRRQIAVITREVVVDACALEFVANVEAYIDRVYQDVAESPNAPPYLNPGNTYHSSLLQALSIYSNLQVLDLKKYATDRLVEAFVVKDCFPRLKIIRMQRSDMLTDRGLENLSRHNTCQPVPCTKDNSDDNHNQSISTGTNEDSNSNTPTGSVSTLEEIDITFCKNTTYQGTFPLRDKLPQLRLLRRQPEWLDGEFHTPFGDAIEQEDVEVHTYWPDGTFSFNRASQSTGFVLSWNEWATNPSFIGDRLQFNNFSPAAWPVWSRYAYRPGVCLLQLSSSSTTPGPCDPNDNNDNSDNTPPEGENQRCVLVGQRLRGLQAPHCYDLIKLAAPLIPVGTSRYVDPNDLQTSNELQIHTEPDPERERLLFSKMKVFPLSTPMPPKELVEECRGTCQAMERYGEEFLSQKEHELDTIL